MRVFVAGGFAALTVVLASCARPLPAGTAPAPTQDQRRAERVGLLALCGVEDWLRPVPVHKFEKEDIETLDRLVPLAQYNSLAPGDLMPRGSEPPAACSKLQPVLPSQPELPMPPQAETGCERVPCFSKEQAGVVVDPAGVRFAVIGDAGYEATGSFQRAVAARVKQVCKASEDRPRQCAFAVFLGDNLYPDGISSLLWRARNDQKKLARLVATYGLPAFLSLGNHDWHPLTASVRRANRTLAFASGRKDMFGNAHFYDFQAGPVRLWAMDTNYIVRAPAILKRLGGDPWLKRLRETKGPWKIAFGHHPYLSNGHHGNAGEYQDALSLGWRGKEYRDFLRRDVLPNVDLLLSGHDHNLEFYPSWRQDQSGAALVVSGAAAKCHTYGKRLNTKGGTTAAPTFEVYAPGFTVVEATPDRLTVDMHWLEGNTWRRWTTYRSREETWAGNAPLDLSGRPCRDK